MLKTMMRWLEWAAAIPSKWAVLGEHLAHLVLFHLLNGLSHLLWEPGRRGRVPVKRSFTFFFKNLRFPKSYLILVHEIRKGNSP